MVICSSLFCLGHRSVAWFSSFPFSLAFVICHHQIPSKQGLAKSWIYSLYSTKSLQANGSYEFKSFQALISNKLIVELLCINIIIFNILQIIIFQDPHDSSSPTNIFPWNIYRIIFSLVQNAWRQYLHHIAFFPSQKL